MTVSTEREYDRMIDTENVEPAAFLYERRWDDEDRWRVVKMLPTGDDLVVENAKRWVRASPDHRVRILYPGGEITP